MLLASGILLCGALISARQLEEYQPAAVKASPPASGMVGAICWAAIVENGYQVSSRCDFGERSATVETLNAYQEARSKLGARFLENGWSEETLAKFRVDQGGADASTDQLCGFDEGSETGRFLIRLAQTKPRDVREATESVLAIPDPPKWGTCL